ncbi:response regulator [Lacrimispora saccharolytica]|nr:response regulator [Lacrimispora saccharolytica]
MRGHCLFGSVFYIEDARTIPIIAMTANAFAEDRKKAFDAGMDGHIAKPIDIEKLRAVIFSVLNKQEN